jgi:hypothetical protein
MKNKYLKGWKNANDILNAFIDSHFGLYLSRPTEETGYISFLPEDKLVDLIPGDVAPALNDRAREFTLFLIPILEKHSILDDVPDGRYDHQECIIRQRFHGFEKVYQGLYGETVVETMKSYLGLREAYSNKRHDKALLKINLTNEHKENTQEIT